MKTIANCFNLEEAVSFKSLLESAGIPCFIPDEISAGIVPHHFVVTASGIRVQVADENADEAREIVEAERKSS